MDKAEVIKKLEALAELRAKRDLLGLEEREKIEEIMSPAAVIAVNHVKVMYETLREETENDILKAEGDVKAAVLELGETISGGGLQAVWSKGRETWDVKGLRGYAVARPELKELLDIGEPTISIRTVGK